MALEMLKTMVVIELRESTYEFEKHMQPYIVVQRCSFPVERFRYQVLPTVAPLAELDTTLQQLNVAEGLCPAVGCPLLAQVQVV
jgi:hypothetical protein